MKELRNFLSEILIMISGVIVGRLTAQEGIMYGSILIGTILICIQIVKVYRWFEKKDKIMADGKRKEECARKFGELLSRETVFGFYQLLGQLEKRDKNTETVLEELENQFWQLIRIFPGSAYYHIPYVMTKLQPFVNLIADADGKIDKERRERNKAIYNSVIDEMKGDKSIPDYIVSKLRKLPCVRP